LADSRISRSQDVIWAFGLRTIPDNVGNILLDSATWRTARKTIRTFLIKENYDSLRRGTAVALFSFTTGTIRCGFRPDRPERRLGEEDRKICAQQSE
jgi:hypothetical protein